jgi:hypothetical protein
MLHKFNKMVKSKAECEWTIYEKESKNSGAAVIDVEAVRIWLIQSTGRHVTL